MAYVIPWERTSERRGRRKGREEGKEYPNIQDLLKKDSRSRKREKRLVREPKRLIVE